MQIVTTVLSSDQEWVFQMYYPFLDKNYAGYFTTTEYDDIALIALLMVPQHPQQLEIAILHLPKENSWAWAVLGYCGLYSEKNDILKLYWTLQEPRGS